MSCNLNIEVTESNERSSGTRFSSKRRLERIARQTTSRSRIGCSLNHRHNDDSLGVWNTICKESVKCTCSVRNRYRYVVLINISVNDLLGAVQRQILLFKRGIKLIQWHIQTALSERRMLDIESVITSNRALKSEVVSGRCQSSHSNRSRTISTVG